MDCGTLPNPVNGQVNHTAGTTLGQTATYSCNAGYDLVGNSTRVCETTGVWSGSAPTCPSKLFILSIIKGYVYMTYFCIQQLWTVALCLTQPMGELVSLEQHMDR